MTLTERLARMWSPRAEGRIKLKGHDPHRDAELIRRHWHQAGFAKVETRVERDERGNTCVRSNLVNGMPPL